MNTSKRHWLIGIGVLMICVYVTFLYMQYQQLSTYHDEQKAYTEKVVGRLVSLYPEEESQIIEALLTKNIDERNLGATVLTKYGYEEILPMMEDDRFVQFVKDSFQSNGFLIFVLLLLNFILLKGIYKRNLAPFRYVTDQITKLMNNDYTMEEPAYKEGMKYHMFTLLHQLGRKQELNAERLAKEKESLKELVTDISHQVKTPLASLQLYNELLLDSDITNAERNEFLLSNKRTIDKLHDLSDSLINLSRLEIAMIQLKQKPTSLKTLIVNAVNGAYPKAMQKDIDICVEIFSDIEVLVDDKWTEESIFNVIENAVKYTEPNKEIHLTVHSLINFVRVDITDEGIGIKQEEYNRIFQRFYRGSNVAVQETEGSGVGLFLTRKIIEEQGGSIVVKSEVDVGTTFSLFLQKR